jgi:hypothetical protein
MSCSDTLTWGGTIACRHCEAISTDRPTDSVSAQSHSLGSTRNRSSAHGHWRTSEGNKINARTFRNIRLEFGKFLRPYQSGHWLTWISFSWIYTALKARARKLYRQGQERLLPNPLLLMIHESSSCNVMWSKSLVPRWRKWYKNWMRQSIICNRAGNSRLLHCDKYWLTRVLCWPHSGFACLPHIYRTSPYLHTLQF